MNQESIDWLKMHFGDRRKITKNVVKSIPDNITVEVQKELALYP